MNRRVDIGLHDRAGLVLNPGNAVLYRKPTTNPAKNEIDRRPAIPNTQQNFKPSAHCMFTGLIEEVGALLAFRPEAGTRRMEVAAPRLAPLVRPGDSVAVNGCCLTVSTRAESALGFDLLGETLKRTNLETLTKGSRVNLERAVAAGAPLGGHFVQGHVDCASPILALEDSGPDLRLEIELPLQFAHYIISKGSIAVNGISLTIAAVQPKNFTVWIIPHTRAQTNLSAAKAGDLVNLEFDLLAKYVERMLDRGAARPA